MEMRRGFDIIRWFCAGLAAFSLAMPAAGAEGPTRAELSRLIREGEYTVATRNGRIVAANESKKRVIRRKAGVARKSAPKPVAKKPAARKSAPKPRVAARRPGSAKRAPASVNASPKKSAKKSAKSAAPKSARGRKIVARPVRPNSRKPAQAARKPAARDAKKSKKVAKKKSSAAGSARRPAARSAERPSTRVPRARVTPRERDMPLVSVPKSKVKRVDKMIVMDDPGAGPETVAPDPEIVGEPAATVDTSAERTPAETPATIGAPEATTAAQAPVLSGPDLETQSAVREPDAFDLHSGQDPMRPATN